MKAQGLLFVPRSAQLWLAFRRLCFGDFVQPVFEGGLVIVRLDHVLGLDQFLPRHRGHFYGGIG